MAHIARTFLPVMLTGLLAGPTAFGQTPENWTAPPYWSPPSSALRHADARQALASTSSPLPFFALPPCRLVDTRGNAPLTGGFLLSATVRSYTLSGVCNIPANARAVSLNATVVKPVGPGFLTLWPEGGTFPPVSTLNYLGGDVIVNAAVVPLSPTGGISMALGVSGGDVILDTNGYYAPLSDQTPPANPLQIALLRWYPANQSAPTFNAGGGPIGVAFDGASIWVANYQTNNVTKLRASDGAALGTYAVGTTPWAVAFDGANIWVTNYNGNNVTKLRARDGANLGAFGVGTHPLGIAFDGANVWVANQGTNNVTKLRASDGANLGTFDVGTAPWGMAFDGTSVWVTNSGSNNVTKLRASDGANLGTFDVGAFPVGVAFDGVNIWVSNYSGNNVTELHASDGTNLGTFSVGASPEGVAFDGASIWVANSGSGTVTKL